MAFNVSYIYHAIDKFTPAARRIGHSAAIMGHKLKKTSYTLANFAGKAVNATKKLALLGAVAAGFGVREFAKFETALLGVAKTANIEVGESLDRFGDKFTALSLKIPVSAKELLNFGQAAAQLGVEGRGNILNFAEVMAKLTKTTNVMGEEGASQLARLIKITGGSVAQVKNYASALVSLGNTTAATEGEILHFATQLAAAGALYGVTGTQALGLASALRALGVQSEVGGSVIGRSLGIVNKAIRAGGADLRNISFLTQIAGKDLKRSFGRDAIGVIAKLGAGLERLEVSGGDVAKALSVLGLEGIRDIRVLGTLAKNSELVTKKLKQSEAAFKANIALEREFSVQSKSLSNDFQLIINNLSKAGKLFTIYIKPVLESVLSLLDRVTKGLNIVLQSKIDKRAVDSLRERREAGIGRQSYSPSDISAVARSIISERTSSPVGINTTSQSVLNGNITVRAEQGSSVQSAQMSTKGSSGNLGMSMAEAY